MAILIPLTETFTNYCNDVVLDCFERCDFTALLAMDSHMGRALWLVDGYIQNHKITYGQFLALRRRNIRVSSRIRSDDPRVLLWLLAEKHDDTTLSALLGSTVAELAACAADEKNHDTFCRSASVILASPAEFPAGLRLLVVARNLPGFPKVSSALWMTLIRDYALIDKEAVFAALMATTA